VIDDVVHEPLGGAHRDPQAAVRAVGEAIGAAFSALRQMDRHTIRKHRQEKFMAIGRLPQ
jgi:acetyl-CoA carboxylase carboxyl transferase subunit alpha